MQNSDKKFDNLLLMQKLSFYFFLLLATFFLVIALFFVIAAYNGNQSILLKKGQGCSNDNSPYLAKFKKDPARYSTTYCTGNKDILTLTSEFFHVDENYLQFEYAGYPEEDGIDIFIESKDGRRHSIELDNAHVNWIVASTFIPFKDVSVRLVAKDTSSKKRGWIGIGVPKIITASFFNTKTIKLFRYLFFLSLFTICIVTSQ